MRQSIVLIVVFILTLFSLSGCSFLFYTVTFDSQGGTHVPAESVSIFAPTLGTLPESTRVGYTFGGWYTAPAGVGYVFTDSTVVTGDITVYAKWTGNAAATYTVTFDSQNADVVAANPTAIAVTPPSTTIGTMPAPPGRNDYHFGGWFTQPYGLGDEFTTTSTVSADKTVYAYWIPATPGLAYTAIDSATCSVSIGTADATGTVVIADYHSDLKVTNIDGYGFQNCGAITDIKLPSGLIEIGTYAFLNCTGLNDVTIPQGVTILDVAVFYGCTGLTNVTIPNSVTTIAQGVFSYCSGLMTVTLPDSVTDLGPQVFYYCSSLTTLWCYAATPPNAGPNLFDGSPIAYIYVPTASVSLYQVATGWSSYSSYIFAQ